MKWHTILACAADFTLEQCLSRQLISSLTDFVMMWGIIRMTGDVTWDSDNTYVESFMSVKSTDMWSTTAGRPSDVLASSSLSTVLKQLLTVSRPKSMTRTWHDMELRGTKMTGALRRMSSDMRNVFVESCCAAITAPSATAALASRSFTFAASNRFTNRYKYSSTNSITHTAHLFLRKSLQSEPIMT